jgi:hypothetical protein
MKLTFPRPCVLKGNVVGAFAAVAQKRIEKSVGPIRREDHRQLFRSKYGRKSISIHALPPPVNRPVTADASNRRRMRALVWLLTTASLWLSLY